MLFWEKPRKLFPHEDVLGLSFGPLVALEAMSVEILLQKIARNYCQYIVQRRGIFVLAAPVAVRQSTSALIIFGSEKS